MTVKKLKELFKTYLQETHQDISASTIASYSAMAFLACNKDVGFSLIEAMKSNDTFEEAKEKTEEFLLAEHNRKKERVSSYTISNIKKYVTALTLFKEFYDYETAKGEIIDLGRASLEKSYYDIVKRVYTEKKPADAAVTRMLALDGGYSDATCAMIFNAFISMMNGTSYARSLPYKMVDVFIRNISRDFGAEKRRNALKSTLEMLNNYYQKTGQPLKEHRVVCQRISDEYGDDISFDYHIIENDSEPKQEESLKTDNDKPTILSLDNVEESFYKWLYSRVDDKHFQLYKNRAYMNINYFCFFNGLLSDKLFCCTNVSEIAAARQFIEDENEYNYNVVSKEDTLTALDYYIEFLKTHTFIAPESNDDSADEVLEETVELVEEKGSNSEATNESIEDVVIPAEPKTISAPIDDIPSEQKSSNIRIRDVVSAEHSGFLSYCEESGKIFTYELNNVDYVAFRMASGSTREYIEELKSIISKADLIKVEPAEIELPKLINIDTETEIDSSSSVIEVEPQNDESAVTEEMPNSASNTLSEYPKSESEAFDKETDELIDDNEDLFEEEPRQLDAVDVLINNRTTSLADLFNVDASDYQDVKIAKLKLSVRPHNCLKSKKIYTISDLLEKSVKDLAAINNMGRTSLLEIIKRLNNYFGKKEVTSAQLEKDKEKIIPLFELFDVDKSFFENIDIFELALSVRSGNCLRRCGVHTVADLLEKSINNLADIRNMGIKSLNEIVDKLKIYVTENESTPKHFERDSNKIDRHIKDEAFRSAIISLLEGKDDNVELSEEQFEYYNKAKEAVETIGAEICDQAYNNAEYMSKVYVGIEEYIYNYKQFESLKDVFNILYCGIEDSVKNKRLKPLAEMFSSSEKRDLTEIMTHCSDEDNVSVLPKIYDEIYNREEYIATAKLINKFTEWLCFEVQSIVSEFETSVRQRIKDNVYEIFCLRVQGKTLEAIATEYGVTRERIRQIEAKYYRCFWAMYYRQKYDLVQLASIMLGEKSMLYLSDLKDIFGDFADILWTCEKHDTKQKTHSFSKDFGAIILTNGIDAIDESKLMESKREFFKKLPQVIPAEEFDSFINNATKEFELPYDFVNDSARKQYSRTGKMYVKGNITGTYVCSQVLKERFPAGFKIADDYEANRFREYLAEMFGKDKTLTNRALDAKIGDIGILCDRGKYIHPDHLQVDKSIMDAINDFIDQSPRLVLTYGDIFEALKSTFSGTQITNKYLLQGALKKYGCKYHTGRDSVRKEQSVKLIDELERFVEERGVVHKSEIFGEFASMSDANLGQIVARSSFVFNIENGYYIHASQFDIQPEDYEPIHAYLTEACKDIPVNIRAVQDELYKTAFDFMGRNNFDDRNKLFAALMYMFGDEFKFSRPYIAKLGANDISNKTVVLQHIADFDSIDIDELFEICEENSIRFVSPVYLCLLLFPEFVRVNQTTLLRRELTGITDETIEETVEMINDMLETKDYIVCNKIDDFLWFPQIDVDWNAFLLENILTQNTAINTIYTLGDYLSRVNAVFVSEKYKEETVESFIVKVLREEVKKGSFVSKEEMREWLVEQGLIGTKLPKCIEGTKYFYVDQTGVHCKE